MSRRPFQPADEDTGTFLIDVFKIALGVFIGGLCAAFTYEAILAYRAEAALRKMSQQIKSETDRVNAETARQRQQAREAQEAAQQHAEQVRSAEALAARLESERRQRKDAAWSKFYQPSLTCKADSGTASCANEYMAARKRFESLYVDR